MAASSAVWSINPDSVLHHNAHHSLGLQFSRQKFPGNLPKNMIYSLPLKDPVQLFVRLTNYPVRKKKNRLVVSAGWRPGDERINGPIEFPPYDSYIDSNTGEPVPAMGARSSIPNKEFWSEDTVLRVRSAQASLPLDKSVSSSHPSFGQQPGSRRKKFKKHASMTESSAGETVDNESTLEDANSSSDEAEDTSMPYVIREPETNETVDAEELARKYGEPHSFVPQTKAKNPQEGKLPNEDLWWNWRKPPIGKERWSEWQKRAPDVDTVMAMAMAEAGQIKLYGEKPTVAEAALARARKTVLKEERLKAEEERKAEIGPLAYYKEWVKAWKRDTSKEAVQKHFEETGEDEDLQLLNMFLYQTEREYRIMMGTDTRIRRDPLTMRMRPELKKAVFGGDPVYPTINYEQAPDHVIDYRGPNFHEPVPDILEVLRRKGRLISREELAKKLAKEKAEAELEFDDIDEAIAGAIDIGEKEDEDEDKA